MGRDGNNVGDPIARKCPGLSRSHFESGNVISLCFLKHPLLEHLSIPRHEHIVTVHHQLEVVLQDLNLGLQFVITNPKIIPILDCSKFSESKG